MSLKKQTLKLKSAIASALKISLNVIAKDPANTIFTVPVEGIELGRKALNDYMGDGTFESWYEEHEDGFKPRTWVERLPKGEIKLDEEFDAESCVITPPSGQPLNFDAEQLDKDDPENEDKTPAPGARITTIVLKPTSGGITKLACHMQVRPGLGAKNTTLQKCQFQKIGITLARVKLSERKARQQELPLAPAEDAAPAADIPPGDAAAEEQATAH